MVSADYPDGHGPETCNYRECRSESDVPCPFLAEESPGRSKPEMLEPHEHEYHVTVLTCSCGNIVNLGLDKRENRNVV